MVPPYYPAWIDPTKRADPDTVLECRSALWFVDRITHNMSITDIVNGEDGTIDISADEVLYDSLKVGSAGNPPITSVTMVGQANWTQGSVSAGFQVPNAYGSKAVLNGSSIVSSWPKTGDTIAGGYKVTEGFCNDVLNIGVLQPVNKTWSYENRAKTHTVGDVMTSTVSWTLFPAGGHSFISNIATQTGLVPAASTVAYQENEGGGYSSYDPYASIDGATMGSDQVMIPMHVSYNVIMVPNWRIDYGLSLGIDAGAKVSETIQFTIYADLQPIAILPDPTLVTTTIQLSTQDLASDTTGGSDGVTPPVSSSSDSFANTAEGNLAVGYMVAVARAAIRKAARAVTATCTTTFAKAVTFSLRKNARIFDNRIPAGHCEGKITAYSFGFDGEIETGTVEILPAVGNIAVNVNVVAPTSGTPVWVDNFVDNWQQENGGITLIPGVDTFGDVGYAVDPYLSGGVTALSAADCVVAAEWQTGTVQVQTGSDDLPGGGTRTYFNTFETTKFHLELAPLSGINLGANVIVVVTPLHMLKQIDLSAAPI
jgi:hypothetical protein